MNNFLDQRNCIGCGCPVIDTNPLWGMCSACIAGTKEKLLKVKQRKKTDEGSPKRIKMHIPMIAR